jgi:puromycin-sensitive aminopeptidase
MSLGKHALQSIACALCLSLMPSSFAAPPPSTSAAATQSRVQQSPFRLPEIAHPKKYSLLFEPDLAAQTFKGHETITLVLDKPSNSIVLNATELTIQSASITGMDIKAALPAVATLAKTKEQLTLNFPATLKPGTYKVSIKFTGILNDKLRGFYRSSYTSADGKKVPIATTQMEPTDARRMFPCFDEPAYKASYQITAVIDKNSKAISNAAVLSERPGAAGKKVVTFADTPAMSTYLVALIIGNFESTPAKTVDGVQIRVWSVPGKQKMGTYALDVAGRLMTYYNKYFGIPYPTKKLDLIAIPDFEAGAMENLGAITFRETALLVDDKTSSTDHKQGVAGIVAHEMAHMWFGDLVTMKWWDDLWLNEAFATWMATKAVDALFPQWHEWDQFGLTRSAALSSDSLRSTRAIHFEVRDPNQANEMFDEITYSKGASVLRMLEKFVSENTFQKGVHQYLSAHAFGNATTEQLWQAIGDASGKPIPKIMHGWVYQPGYPLISTQVNGESKKLTLEQGRFYLDPPKDKAPKNIWEVPIGMRDLAASDGSVKLLNKPEDQFELSEAAAGLIANAGGDGFYRVKYPREILQAFQPQIQQKMSVPERLGLLSDQFALTIAGKVPITDYLQLTASYKDEQDPSVMSAMIGQFSAIRKVMDSSLQPQFSGFVRDRLVPTKTRLGWQAGKDESDLVRMLRADVLKSLGTFGQDNDTIKEARERYSVYLKKPDAIDPDLIDPVIDIVAYNGGAAEYEEIKHLWKTAKTPEAEHRALMALALFRKPELIKQTLAMSLSKDVRTQDAPHLLSIELSNDIGKELAWNFTKTNWEKLKARFPMNMLPRIVGAAGSISTPEHEADLRAFFKSHPVPAGKRAVAKLLERVSINVNFRKNSEGALKNWLSTTKLSSAE